MGDDIFLFGLPCVHRTGTKNSKTAAAILSNRRKATVDKI